MLIIEPCAGLSNRILAVATAYSLAKKTGHRLVLLWDIDGAVGIPVEELFVLPADIRIVRTTKLPYRRKLILRLKSELIRRKAKLTADKFLDCCDIEYIRKHNGQCTVRKYLTDNKKLYIKSFCELEDIQDNEIFKIFKPAPQVLEYGDRVFAKVTDRTVGIHIRRTDHAEAIKNSPLTLFENKMQELLDMKQAEQFFLATDDKSVENQMKSRFGDRIICHDNKKFSRSDAQGMLDGLIDMLALSRCGCIYGSYGSTFSRMAAYLGDKELIILSI